MGRQCLICETPVAPFMSFGRAPIANGFLTPDQFDHEFFYELEIGLCPDCAMAQLTQVVDPARLFHEDYAFFSSTSQGMRDHFRAFAITMNGR